MIELEHAIPIIIIAAGAFFMFIGSVGLLRLPDFYTRTHATSKSDTLGIMLVLGGLAIYEGFTLNSAKLLLAIVFVGFANPIGAHALARAALKQGLKPWFNKNDDKENMPRKDHE